jgi:hypothetical protein
MRASYQKNRKGESEAAPSRSPFILRLRGLVKNKGYVRATTLTHKLPLRLAGAR